VTHPMPTDFPQLQFEQHLRQTPVKCPVIPAEQTPEPTPPIGCDRGTMINQNLPTALCGVGHRVDHTLPPGTLEVWQDGKRIGRIENIGLG